MMTNIVFLATADFAVPSLKAVHEKYGIKLLVTQPDKPAGRSMRLRCSPAKIAALELGLDIYQPLRVRSEESLQRIATARPDIIWTAAYGQILPLPLLQMPRLGSVNLHGSLLPAYRGAAPVQRAILNGDTETGVTTLFMTMEVDAGDIIACRRVAIDDDDDTITLTARLADEGVSLVLQTTEMLLSGKADEVSDPQNDALATYAPPVGREEAEIDWSHGRRMTRDKIRAMIPWPIAWTWRRGERVRIWKANPAPDRKGKPGELLEAGRCLIIGTGDGALKIDVLQPQDRNRMTAEQFINGYRPQAGEIWGLAPTSREVAH